MKKQYGRVVGAFGYGVNLSGFTSLSLRIFVVLNRIFKFSSFVCSFVK